MTTLFKSNRVKPDGRNLVSEGTFVSCPNLSVNDLMTQLGSLIVHFLRVPKKDHYRKYKNLFQHLLALTSFFKGLQKQGGEFSVKFDPAITERLRKKVCLIAIRSICELEDIENGEQVASPVIKKSNFCEYGIDLKAGNALFILLKKKLDDKEFLKNLDQVVQQLGVQLAKECNSLNRRKVSSSLFEPKSIMYASKNGLKTDYMKIILYSLLGLMWDISIDPETKQVVSSERIANLECSRFINVVEKEENQSIIQKSKTQKVEKKVVSLNEKEITGMAECVMMFLWARISMNSVDIYTHCIRLLHYIVSQNNNQQKLALLKKQLDVFKQGSNEAFNKVLDVGKIFNWKSSNFTKVISQKITNEEAIRDLKNQESKLKKKIKKMLKGSSLLSENLDVKKGKKKKSKQRMPENLNLLTVGKHVLPSKNDDKRVLAEMMNLHQKAIQYIGQSSDSLMELYRQLISFWADLCKKHG